MKHFQEHFLKNHFGPDNLWPHRQERCKVRLGEREYLKQDGLRCAFFEVKQTRALFQCGGLLACVECEYCTVRNVNRKTKEVMDRVWISGVFERTAVTAAAAAAGAADAATDAAATGAGAFATGSVSAAPPTLLASPI